MSKSKGQMTLWVIGAVMAAMLYFGNKPSENNNGATSISKAASDAKVAHAGPNTFAGYDCTEDCSGHEAGYAWAEEHDISDGDDCDAAGEHSNSPSFAEGCHAYVDGEADPEGSEDPDDDN
jgi:hypothetical protein